MANQQNVSVAEAIAMTTSAAPAPVAETVLLADALGRVLLADLASLADHPNADDSALDGFACRVDDTLTASTERPVRLRLRADALAGRPWQGRIGAGEAVRIATGGVVPEGANAVVAVEDSRLEADGDGDVVVVLAPAQPGAVRPAAQDLRSGNVYLRRGRVLDAGALGLAAAMGHASVPVARRPRVALVTTGDEVVAPGEALDRGEVYGANGESVGAMVRAAGAEVVTVRHVKDDVAALAAALAEVGEVDLLVTSGAVSMGPRDIVRDLMQRHGEIVFWKVRVRPGGPTLFGRYRGVPLLGLPGNPVSSMVTFLLFGRPFLDAASGADVVAPYYRRVHATATTRFAAAPSKEVLARAHLVDAETGREATGYANQSSGVLRSMAEANALALVPAGVSIEAGEAVGVIELERFLR